MIEIKDITEFINQIAKTSATEDEKEAFQVLLDMSLATTYQGKGAKDAKYHGVSMNMGVAMELNRDYERKKKPKKFDKLTHSMDSLEGGTLSTVQERLENDEILSETFEKQDNRTKIVISHYLEGYSFIEIEKETGIAHQRASESLNKFIADAKKIDNS